MDLLRNISSKVLGGSHYAWAIAREAGASLLTYELYPLGFVGKSVPAVPKLWTKKTEEKIPILFVHGVFHNRTAFAWLKQRLASKGWHRFKEVDLMTSIHPIPMLAEQVATEARELLRQYQTPYIDIVAHSMGGIVSRYYVQCLGGDGLVRNLITLGSPHEGTTLSKLSVLPHIRDMRPGSPILEKLNSLPPLKHTRTVTVSGNLDLFMQPASCTNWKGARNIRLKHVGHAGLLFSKRVFQIIASHCGEEVSTEHASQSKKSGRSVPSDSRLSV